MTAKKDFTNAEPLLRQSFDYHVENYGKTNVHTLNTGIALGECLSAQAPYNEAESFLKGGYQSLAGTLGNIHG